VLSYFLRAAIGWLLAPLALALLVDFQAPLKPLPDGQVMLAGVDGIPGAVIGARRKLAPIAPDELHEWQNRVFIAAEDRRFERHLGIDPIGMMRAAWIDMQCLCRKQGGSTIEEQLIKNAYLSAWPALARKLVEPSMALALGLRMSKAQKLAAYLSIVDFGNRQIGLRAAARFYFNREPRALTSAQTIALASVLPAPNSTHSAEARRARRNHQRAIISTLRDLHWLHGDGAVASLDHGSGLPDAGWFADTVAKLAPDSVASARADGRTILVTTFDPVIQRAAELIVAARLRRQPRSVQAAVVVMRIDGAILGIVGGRAYPSGERRVFNRAFAARPAGSTFKLADLHAALENGMSLDDLVFDGPGDFRGWTPKDDDGRWLGWIGSREAFAESRNLAAVRWVARFGLARLRHAAVDDLGLRMTKSAGLAAALGVEDQTLVALTQAYARVSANDMQVTAHVLPQPRPSTYVPFPDAASLCEALAAVVQHGTGSAARTSLPTVGKTGTTQDSRDALFIGIVGDLVIGVRLGRDDDRPMSGMSGGGLPALLFRDIASQAITAGHLQAHACGTANNGRSA
jgi:penicillin-binding protein 1A